MNEQWVNDLRAEPVDTNPRPGFQAELRATLIAEQNGAATSTRRTTTGHRRLWLLGAAAACVASLIGGLLVFGGSDETLTRSTVPEATTAITQGTVPSTEVEPAPSTAPETPTPTVLPVAADVVVTDTQAINLDQWIDPAATPPPAADIVAIDRQALPEGWEISDEDGRLLLYPPDTTGYLYTAVITTADQAVFEVTFSREPFPSDPCFLPVSGFPGTVGDLTGATPGEAVCGQTAAGDNLAVVPADGSNIGSQWSALDVANSLSFVEAADVPHPDLTTAAGNDEPAEVDLAGTLTGARWAITGERSSTRRIDLYVAGKLLGGADVLAPSSLQTSPVVEGSITGVPGYGAVAYGDVEGNAVTVIVTLDDGRTARLPTAPFYERSNFAVPIPDSVNVATLTFVAADGSALVTVDVPDIPLGYGGGFLGIRPRR